MIKPIRVVLFFLAIFLFTPKSYAQFPYLESFRDATASGIFFGGAPSAFLTASGSSANGGTPIDPMGAGYLRLTNAEKNQKGYAYSMSDFPSSNGLKVEFEYATYGGSRADGISFFLFDATASPFVIGGFGGSLGYAPITTTNPISPGVSKGYLAIGLDEYGNFSNPTEGRQGGTTFVPGSITLRGKGDGAALTPDNYRFLTTVHPDELGVSLIGDGSQRISDPTNAAYRKVSIELIPNPSGGYNINVYLTKGGSPQQKIKVIDNYYYSDAAPEKLRYGFASSTGDDTNFHEIRNVSIDLYTRNPIVTSSVKNACLGTVATIDVIASGKANETNTSLDKLTVDLDPATPGLQKTFTVAGKGVFSVNSEGIVQFVPVAGFIGTATANYNLRDTNGTLSNTASVTFSYSSPPAAPNAGANETINVFTPTGTYTLQAAAPAPNTGKWTQVSGPSTAVFVDPTLNNTAVNNLISGVYVFRWTITSPGGCTASADVQVTVNHPPVAVNDVATTPLNTPVAIPILDNDTDDNGNANINRGSIVIKTQPQSGTLSINYTTGVVTYIPNAGFTGTDSFTYTVKDAQGAESNVATVTIVVNKVLVGTDDVANTTVNNPVVIHVLDNDPKKSGAFVLKNSDPLHGSVVVNPDGTVTYTPTPGYSGKDTFTYKLANANGDQSDPITVTVNVKPTGLPDLANTRSNEPVIINVKDNDPGKTGTTLVPISSPLNGTITINPAGNVVYTPNPGFSGKDSFQYVLRTADGLDSDPIVVTINVKPIGSPDAITTTPDVAVILPIKDNDLSKVGTTVVLATNPAHGTVTVNPDGTVGYLPSTGYSGKDTFTYVLRTADGLDSDPITVNILVKPIGSTDNIVIPPDAPAVISVKDNDVSKLNTTVTVITNPLHGTAVANPSGTVTYTPTPGYSGKDTFTYTLRTSDGLESDPIVVNITIKPVGVNDQVNTPLNTPITIPVKDNDPSKTGTSIVINSNPANGTVTINPAGLPVYTPNAGFTGTDNFTYILRTADGVDSDPITVSIGIKPVGVNDNASTTTNTPVVIPVKANDPSTIGTTVVLNTVPANGTAVLNPDGTITYTPNPGFSGKDTFTYRLTTPNGGTSDPITVNVNVIPSGIADVATTNIGIPVTIPVKDNDNAKTGTSVVIVTNPAHGTVTINGAGLPVYTPTPGYAGPDSFTYLLRTADGLESSPITVNITVRNPITDPPKIGVAKNLVNAIKNADGSYQVTYLFTLKNYGELTISKVSLVDDLKLAFLGNSIRVTNLTASGTLKANPNYNGISDQELLDPSNSTLAAYTKATVTLEFNIDLDQKEGKFDNFAVAKGSWNNNGVETPTTDQSTDGLNPDPDPSKPGDVSPSISTPVNLIRKDIFIPGGFSPNNDGINDFFVIENTQGKQISLEVYNRWGNRIHKATKYENNWAGKTTEGIHIGDDVPAGTYYYIITIDNKDKRVGYITINR